MLQNGPLVLVDDDADDQELISNALRELGFDDEIKSFSSAEAAISFLYESNEPPFMIVSDINMPKMDGITFKMKIDGCKNLNPKRIPFIFLSTSTKFVCDTHGLNIQGYFEKGNSWYDLKETMKVILSYWKRTKHVTLN